MTANRSPRTPRVPELVALAAGLAVFVYLGWDAPLWNAREQLALHLLAAGAAGGLVMLGARGGLLPRSGLELPILVLLLAIAAAALTAENHGLSARALASTVASAAMLPVALVALRHRPAWVALVVSLPVIMLGVATLAVMLPRRITWLLNDGPGLLAPARLAAEGTPFGSVAVPPFIFLATLPLTFLIRERRVRTGLQVALLTVGVPLALLSGSRSAWLAIGVAIVVVLPSVLPRLRRPARLRAVHLAAALGGVALLAVTAIAIVPRLTALTSLVYRGALWRDTLAAVGDDLLLGIGPGSMSYARMAAAEPFTFPVRQPHSHNLPLGIFGDAGLLGLAAAAVLLVGFLLLAGPWRQKTPLGRSSVAVLVGFGVAGLFEDLTFLPNYNLLVILLGAIALSEAGAVRWRRLPRATPLLSAAAVGTLALGVVMAVGDAAAIDYRRGIDAFAAGDHPAAQRRLGAAEQLDPWHPAHPKALAVAASANGDIEASRAAAERAVARNAGDGPSWTNLALACLALDDPDCAETAARRGLERTSGFGLQAINAALVFEHLQLTDAADEAYRFSLLVSYATGLASDWPRSIDVGIEPVVGIGTTSAQVNLVIGRATQGQSVDGLAISDPVAEALAHAIRGDIDAADDALARAMHEIPESPLTWDLAYLLAERRGLDSTRARRLGEVVRGFRLSPDAGGVPVLSYDIGSFRAYPLDGYARDATRLIPEPAWPWALEAVLPDD